MSLGGLIVLWTVVLLCLQFLTAGAFVYGVAVVMAIMMAYLVHTSNRLKDMEKKLDQLLEQQKKEEK